MAPVSGATASLRGALALGAAVAAMAAGCLRRRRRPVSQADVVFGLEGLYRPLPSSQGASR